MTVWDMQNALDAKQAEKSLGRSGLSEAAIKAVSDFDGSYKGAMVLAGKMKAIAQAAKFDSYWNEKVEDGYMKMLFELRNPPTPIEAKSK